MKPLLTIFTLVFTVMFSSTSFAEWSKVSKNVSGYTFYVDFERIRKHDGYVYFWELIDRVKPTNTGVLSDITYQQGDCRSFRYKTLNWFWHKEPMGGGSSTSDNNPHKEWNYPPPGSMSESILRAVCSR